MIKLEAYEYVPGSTDQAEQKNFMRNIQHLAIVLDDIDALSAQLGHTCEVICTGAEAVQCIAQWGKQVSGSSYSIISVLSNSDEKEIAQLGCWYTDGADLIRDHAAGYSLSD